MPGAIVTATDGIIISNGFNSVIASDVSIDADTASASQQGLLAAADFASFAAKQNPITYTPSAPARVLGTAFQPSTTKATYVYYTISISCSASLTGGQAGKVELLCDAASNPNSIRGRVSNANSVSLAIALTAMNSQEMQLSYLVPPGHYVKLVSTNITGTPTISITQQAEVAVG